MTGTKRNYTSQHMNSFLFSSYRPLIPDELYKISETSIRYLHRLQPIWSYELLARRNHVTAPYFLTRDSTHTGPYLFSFLFKLIFKFRPRQPKSKLISSKMFFFPRVFTRLLPSIEPKTVFSGVVVTRSANGLGTSAKRLAKRASPPDHKMLLTFSVPAIGFAQTVVICPF